MRLFWCIKNLSLLLALASRSVAAWILPGNYPIDHEEGDEIPIKVNSLTSPKTQVPYGYYFAKFPRPKKITEERENLGEILLGDRIENSLYTVRMKKDEVCKMAGDPVVLNEMDRDLFIQLIEEDYRINWICENLPVHTSVSGGVLDSLGFPIGYRLGRGEDLKLGAGISGTGKSVQKNSKPKTTILNNHVDIYLEYHSPNGPNSPPYRVVGFTVEPRSMVQKRIAGESGVMESECVLEGESFVLEERSKVSFSYSAFWRFSDRVWVSRYDGYLCVGGEVHWITIMNSFCMVLFLTGVVGIILLRTVKRDILVYTQEDLDEIAEESGWKLIHGDVFRPPPYSRYLFCSVGSGVQILCMVWILLFCIAFDIISPLQRGKTLQTALILLSLMALPAGYIANRLTNTFTRVSPPPPPNLAVTALTAILFPGVCCSVFVVVNVFLSSKASSGAVPLSTIATVLGLWIVLSFPLTFVGAHLGRTPFPLPLKTNQIPRQIPPQHWLSHPLVSCATGGILTFRF